MYIVTEDPKKKIGGIFSPTLLAQVLCWKYVYHLSANRIKKMLRNQGIYISKGSLNGINPESYLEDVFRSILFGIDREKRDFLPCYYQAQELPELSAIEMGKLLSTAA